MLPSYAVPDLGRLVFLDSFSWVRPVLEKLVGERHSRTCLSAVPTARILGKVDGVGREGPWSMAALRLQALLAAPTEFVLKRSRLGGWCSPPRSALGPAWGGTRSPPCCNLQFDWLEADDLSSLLSAAARSSRRHRCWWVALGASSRRFCSMLLVQAFMK